MDDFITLSLQIVLGKTGDHRIKQHILFIFCLFWF